MSSMKLVKRDSALWYEGSRRITDREDDRTSDQIKLEGRILDTRILHRDTWMTKG